MVQKLSLVTTLVVVGYLYAPTTFAQLEIIAPSNMLFRSVRVIDGDTVEVTTAGKRLGIGLIGVRAPRGNSECGRLATGALWGLSAAGLVFEEDAEGIPHEKYRRLYYARAADGRSVAEHLVLAGLARADGRGRERAALAAAENEARSLRRGCLWQ
ncbi:MAG: thermonuclease family protein [Vicinamibacterales bacterium]